MVTGSQKYGIGIVGCGSISDTHADAILHTEHGHLAAAHSRTGSNLDRFCDKYSLAGSSSYDEFLAMEDLDIVVICTPSGTHLDYGVEAAKAGKHIIIEKPLEITVSRGEELIAECRKNSVKLAVIYQSRFMDSVLQMKKAVDLGDIGRLFMASGSVKWYRDQDYYSNSGWRGTLALDGGGAVINQAIHTLDLLNWMTGGVECVQAFKGTYTHHGIEAEDNAVASLKFKNGAIGLFTASTSVIPPHERQIEIHGEKGTALLAGDSFRLLLSGSDSKTTGSGESVGAADPMAGMTFINHKKQYDQILNAISKGDVPPVSGEESLQSLAVVEALYRSAEEGRLVRVDEILSTGRISN